jgi:hypothetical protein
MKNRAIIGLAGALGQMVTGADGSVAEAAASVVSQPVSQGALPKPGIFAVEGVVFHS